LQTQIRDVLPSQNGFGSELQASNVIVPIIDLTSTAEGSVLPSDLQNALSFGSQTAFDTVNTTDTLANSPGFYRIFGVSSIRTSTGASSTNTFTMSDGSSNKIVWGHKQNTPGSNQLTVLEFDFVVFLAAGESITATSPAAVCSLIGSSRQIATGDGTLVNPNGFPL